MRLNNFYKLALITTSLLLVSCVTTNKEGTLGSLGDVKFELKQEKVDGSLEKAMASYEEFLKNTPETDMTPEALRRLADLKIQKDYVADEPDAQAETSTATADKAAAGVEAPQAQEGLAPVADSASQATDISTPTTGFVPVDSGEDKKSIATTDSPIADISESEKEFSERAGKKIDLGGQKKKETPEGITGKDADDLQAAGAREAPSAQGRRCGLGDAGNGDPLPGYGGC